MKKKIVSVVVTTHNNEKTIEQTLNSVIDQTFENIEIIVINDGSTDGTENILSKFSDEITLITTNSKGPGAARNTGIEVATGNYITFMDGDDYFSDKNAITKMVELSERCRADLVITDFNYVDESGKTIKKWHSNKKIEHIYPSAWGKLFKIELWGEIRFPENILYEDAGVIMAIWIQARNVAVLHQAIYSYRQSEKTITQSLDNPIRHLDSIVAFRPYLKPVDDLKIQSKKKSAVHYMNHIIMGHVIVVKVEYKYSQEQVITLNNLLSFMETPVLKKYGFSDNVYSNILQYLVYHLLKSDNFQFVLNLILKQAILIRNKRRNRS